MSLKVLKKPKFVLKVPKNHEIAYKSSNFCSQMNDSASQMTKSIYFRIEKVSHKSSVGVGLCILVGAVFF